VAQQLLALWYIPECTEKYKIAKAKAQRFIGIHLYNRNLG